jgi:TP901 family phage tail tape measure protein
MPPTNTATVTLDADYSRLASGLRSGMRLINSFSAGAGAHLANVGLRNPKKGQGWGAHATGQVVGNLASRGLDMLADQGKKVLDFERDLTRLGISARLSAPQIDTLRKAITEVSVATGIDRNVVQDSYRAYVDLAGAQSGSISKMTLLAKAGQATGAEGKDLAGMMYQLTRSMKVTDAQMEDTIGGLINQAKDGAIEVKQMSAEFSSMMPIFARFGVTGREGAIRLGAMYQVTRDGFDSASQAATGMIRLMAGLQRHASRFKEHGVEVFKPGSKKNLREMSDIMAQIKRSPLHKDIEALIKAFGRSEAWRTYELLAEAPKRVKELENAGRANNVVMQDLQKFTTSAAGRMDLAFAKLGESVSNALSPERIDVFAEAIGKLLGVLGDALVGVGKLADGLRWVTSGRSFEEQAAATQAKRLDERRGFHERQLEDEYAAKGLAPFDPKIHEIIEKQAMQRVGQEDAIRNAIEKGERIGTGHRAAGARRRIGMADIGASSPEKNLGAYSVSELEALRRMPGITGASDSAMLLKVIDDAITRTKKSDDEFMKKLGDSFLAFSRQFTNAVSGNQTVVQVDGNPIAKAGANATDQRRK